MKTINRKIFPLAEKIVISLLKSEVNYLIITSEPTSNACGYYRHSNKSIALNVGNLQKVFDRYEITADNMTEAFLRTAAAIVYEESYHAMHHDFPSNTEAKAATFASKKAEAIPTETLYRHGGILYKLAKTMFTGEQNVKTLKA